MAPITYRPAEPLAAFESAAPKTDLRLYAACVGREDNNMDVVFYPIFNQEGLFSEARRLTATKRYLPPGERQSSFDIADAPRQVILQEPVG